MKKIFKRVKIGTIKKKVFEFIKSKLLLNIVLVLFGTLLASLSLQIFLIPNKIIDGGVTGIALLIDYVTPGIAWLSFPVLIIILNLPFLYLGYKNMGKIFLALSMLAIFSLSLMQLIFLDYNLYLDDPLLAAIFGGIILGVGVGLIMKNNGSVDGLDILSMYISKSMPFSVGEIILAIDIVIFIVAAFVLGIEQSMYSIITYFIVSKTIDVVMQGLDETKVVIIVSNKSEKIKNKIICQLNRGVTVLKGKGGFTEDEKEILYVVVSRLEIMTLKEIIHINDPMAFVTLIDTSEVRGGQINEKLNCKISTHTPSV